MVDDTAFVGQLEETLTYNLKQVRQLLVDYKKIKKPTGVDTLRLRAYSLYFSGYDDMARSFFNALVAVECNEHNLNKLAQLEVRNKNYSRALEIAEKVLGSWPESELGFHNIVTSHIGLGNGESAVQAAEQANKLFPKGRMPVLLVLAKSLEKLPTDKKLVDDVIKANPWLSMMLSNVIEDLRVDDPAWIEGSPWNSTLFVIMRSEAM